jgi:hypothetical protein
VKPTRKGVDSRQGIFTNIRTNIFMKYLPARSDNGTNKIGGGQQARNFYDKKYQYFHEIFVCKIKQRNEQDRG